MIFKYVKDPIEKALGSPLVGVAEVARFLNVSHGVVYRAASDGELRCSRVGGQLRFEPSDVRDYLESRRLPGPNHVLLNDEGPATTEPSVRTSAAGTGGYATPL